MSPKGIAFTRVPSLSRNRGAYAMHRKTWQIDLRFLLRRFPILITLSLPCVATGQQKPGPWSIARSDGGMAAIAVQPAGSNSWSWQFAMLDVTTLVAHPSVALCTLQSFTGPPEAITLKRLQRGDWAIADSYLPGGTHSSHYVVVDKDAFAAHPVPQTAPYRVDGLRLVTQTQHEQPAIRDVSIRQIIEAGGEPYLVGESYGVGPDAPTRHVAWCAPARIVNDTLTGVIIGDGQNPHAVQTEGHTLVVIQAPRARVSDHPVWGGQLRLYASDDLEQWKPFPGPPDDLEFGDFDLCVTRDGLTIVGLADTNPPDGRTRDSARYEPALALVTLVYDAGRQRWNTVAARRDKSLSPEMEVKVIPPEAIDGRLMLIEREPDGRFRARSPMQ